MSELKLDAKTTALVVIDLQNAIVGRPELAPYAGADIVGKSNALADAVRSKGGQVVWVHVLIHEFQQHLVDAQGPTGGGTPPKEASELVADVKVTGEDIVVAKRSWGAFLKTDLDERLQARGVKTVVMAGIATNMGVESTARSAFDYGYDVVFAEDAMSSLSAEWHRFAVENIFPRMGRVRSAEQVIAALE